MDATEASAVAQAVAPAGAVAVALLPLITWSWEDLGPGAVAAGWWVLAGAGAARLWALLPAPRGTRAGAAMAPGFGIAFLGDALGPLGFSTRETSSCYRCKEALLRVHTQHFKSILSNEINSTLEAKVYSHVLARRQ